MSTSLGGDPFLVEFASDAGVGSAVTGCRVAPRPGVLCSVGVVASIGNWTGPASSLMAAITVPLAPRENGRAPTANNVLNRSSIDRRRPVSFAQLPVALGFRCLQIMAVGSWLTTLCSMATTWTYSSCTSPTRASTSSTSIHPSSPTRTTTSFSKINLGRRQRFPHPPRSYPNGGGLRVHETRHEGLGEDRNK